MLPLNGYEKQDPQAPLWVWFTGSTALLEGQGVCYDFDSGTATAANGVRMNRVELPSITNSRFFAGVAARDYNAVTNGQLIKVCAPGSTCNILSKASTTIGAGRLTCEAGGTYAGYFRYAGFEGEGSCVPLQTVDRSTTAGKCQARLDCGSPSGLVEVPALAADTGATTFMVGGVTIFDTALTPDADITATVADGTIPGQRKGFSCTATFTTHDVLVTFTSATQGVLNADPTTTLATFEMDADEEEIVVEWQGLGAAGGLWVAIGGVGGAIA